MMTLDEFQILCEQRRSIRYFSDQPLKKEEVESLLRLAVLSPNIENTQPWHFHIIFDQALRTKLMEASCYGNFVEGAAALIVVSSEKSVLPASKQILWNPRELEYSCASAMQNILLGATAINLGSCWVSLQHGKAAEILHIPREQVIVGGIMLGHYKKGEEQSSDEHMRVALDDVCEWHE